MKVDKTSITVDCKLGLNTIIQPFCNIYKSNIGNNTKIGAYTEIGRSSIGNDCKIGAKVFIPPGILIGDRVFIGPATIFTNDKHPKAVGPWECLCTVVEDDVSIGAGCVILPGITIGKGAIIGAGSVVTKDIKENTLVYGYGSREK